MDSFILLGFGDTGWGDEMLRAALVTILVSLSAMAIGLLVSVFATMSKLSSNGFIRSIGNTYTTVVRGIPELLVIYLLYLVQIMQLWGSLKNYLDTINILSFQCF